MCCSIWPPSGRRKVSATGIPWSGRADPCGREDSLRALQACHPAWSLAVRPSWRRIETCEDRRSSIAITGGSRYPRVPFEECATRADLAALFSCIRTNTIPGRATISLMIGKTLLTSCSMSNPSRLLHINSEATKEVRHAAISAASATVRMGARQHQQNTVAKHMLKSAVYLALVASTQNS